MNSYQTYCLASRLGLIYVANKIKEKHGPWIMLTAKAQFALKAAGMLDA